MSKNMELETLDITHQEGLELSNELNIKSFPALVVNHKIVAVGHPNEKNALKIIETIQQ